jgi:hypothetical protein
MNGGKRKPTKWNLFVKKVFHEGKSKSAKYSFKQALTDASRRKSEIGGSHTRKTQTISGGKSRRHRKR